MALRSKLGILKAAKERHEERRLTVRLIALETGLSPGTIQRLLTPSGYIDGISADTATALAAYFGVGVGDLLEIVPDTETPPQ